MTTSETQPTTGRISPEFSVTPEQIERVHQLRKAMPRSSAVVAVSPDIPLARGGQYKIGSGKDWHVVDTLRHNLLAKIDTSRPALTLDGDPHGFYRSFSFMNFGKRASAFGLEVVEFSLNQPERTKAWHYIYEPDEGIVTRDLTRLFVSDTDNLLLSLQMSHPAAPPLVFLPNDPTKIVEPLPEVSRFEMQTMIDIIEADFPQDFYVQLGNLALPPDPLN